MQRQPDRKKIHFLLLTYAMIAGIAFLFFLLFYVHEEKKQPRIFGATYMTMNNPYFSSLDDSIREAVEARGDILITRDPLQDQDRQNKQIEEMIRDGMTVLFANAVDWEKIQPALAECKKAGVKVFCVDTDVKDSEYVESVIQSDQYEAGRLIAKDMMQRYPNGAKIITMHHYNVHSTVVRTNGFLDAIESNPLYQVVDSTDKTSEIETSNKEMRKMFPEHKDVDVVFGGNDPTAIGALAAIQEYKENHPEYQHTVSVYGIDGSPDAKWMVSRGEMTGTVAQYPIEIARRAVQVAYDDLEGKHIQKSYVIQVSMKNQWTLEKDEISGWQ